MVRPVTDLLAFRAKWEPLETGTPEERACFAAISVHQGDICLTEAEDRFVERVRKDIPLSGFRLAEWIAWNWWRLRWEPRRTGVQWSLAHHLTTIGGGYVWPNITIFSDGERVALVAKPTQARPSEPIRYISDIPLVVRATEFEGAIDLFLNQVAEQLRQEGVRETNFDRTWAEVRAERVDSEMLKWRRLEAMLGFDPDEADPSLIERMLADAGDFGGDAIQEIAADRVQGAPVATAEELREQAGSLGFDTRPRDAVRLSSTVQLPPIQYAAAWKRGAEAARVLRTQEGLGAAPISNQRLSDLSGVERRAITAKVASPTFSFALDDGPDSGRIAFRSKWEAGRRFELARLLGDRLASGAEGRLYLATRGYTYRQKLQRSFAAELLCPFDTLEDMLRGDYSAEAIEEAAHHFIVSERAVRTLLVNHGRLDREDLERDVEAAAAA